MQLTIVTNLAAPYRDGIYRELEHRLHSRVYLLARDEPGRGWARRSLPYSASMVPSISVTGGERPWYIPLPTWILRRGRIMVAGFGPSALVTVALRPRSTLIFSEGTEVTEAKWHNSVRASLRAWAVRRSRACVAVGEESRQYFRSLGAVNILELPNVLDYGPEDYDPPSMQSGAGMSELVIAHVGDWSKRKGADFTAMVFAELAARRTQAAAPRLLIAGNIIDVHVPTGAETLGYLPRKALWTELAMRRTQFLLLPSRQDHWGFVVAEAMASGVLPIVSRNVGSAPDLLRATNPDLIVDTPSDAVRVIERLHSDPYYYDTTRKSLLDVARSRTVGWAADVFCAGLRTL